MTLGKCVIVFAYFIAAGRSERCYHTKCKTSGETFYVDCDQSENRCDYNSWIDVYQGCVYQGYASLDGYKYCLSGTTCVIDSWTGQAECTDDLIDDFVEAGLNIVYVVIIVMVVVVVVIVGTCCICCYCLGKGCFTSRNRNQGRVVVSQGVTYHQPTGNVQTPSHPPAQAYPPGQGGYPPGQGNYPPAQYPPAQYPPAQYPPAQYPPAQYPPAQYPPAQYPPPGGAYPPPHPGGFQSQYPPPTGSKPTPDEVHNQPAENPYM